MEKLSVTNDSIEQKQNVIKRGIPIRDIIHRNDAMLDTTIHEMLELVLEQHKNLSDVEVVFITPEQEPHSGGSFHRIQIDEQTYVPSMQIVTKDEQHLRSLLKIRESSAKRVAELLQIDFAKLSPELLRLFILAHEIGHALDYINNYEKNPDFHNTAEAAEEWDLHYESNLLSMPVPGLDPRDLLLDASSYESLEEYLSAYPEIRDNINLDNVKTLPDLLHEQEIAYRNSSYEKYADTFAVNFLKTNAKKLGLEELLDNDAHKIAA